LESSENAKVIVETNLVCFTGTIDVLFHPF
jgi:hypothetical protein